MKIQINFCVYYILKPAKCITKGQILYALMIVHCAQDFLCHEE